MPDSTTNDLERLEGLREKSKTEWCVEFTHELVAAFPSLVKEIRELREYAGKFTVWSLRDALRAARKVQEQGK